MHSVNAYNSKSLCSTILSDCWIAVVSCSSQSATLLTLLEDQIQKRIPLSQLMKARNLFDMLKERADDPMCICKCLKHVIGGSNA